MIIAIDGPASAGKSSAATGVAEKLGFKTMNTGAMFRAIALKALRAGDDGDEDSCSRLARTSVVTFHYEEGDPRPTAVVLDGEDVTGKIRTPEVDDAASRTSTYKGVREAVLAMERDLAGTGDFVVEGRDIGTVVFPDAELKIFLTADAETRARRRWSQWEQAGELPDITFDDLVAQIEERDARDAGRDIAPLAPAADAVLLDNSEMTQEEVVDFIVGRWRETAKGA